MSGLRHIRWGIWLVVVMQLLSGGMAYAATTDSSTYTQKNIYQLGLPFYDLTSNCSDAGSAAVTLVGSDAMQQAYNFFVTQGGLSNVQAAAVVGNLADESSLNPTALQKGGDSDNPNDAGTDPSDDGWGIAQWSPGGKIIATAQSLGVTSNIDTLATQLEIVLDQMKGTSPNGNQNVLGGIKQINDLATAVTYFDSNFEGGIPGTRQADAQSVLQLYGNSSANSGTTASASPGSDGCYAIDCNTTASGGPATNVSSEGLSQTRQSVVCLAEQQLDIWKSKPGYPTPGYSETGYLGYTDGAVEEWCADFASWIYKQAGYPFTGGTSGGWRLPGVSGIQALGEQNTTFQWHPESSNYTPKPGDLAIHSSPGDTDFHVNIYISTTAGNSTYIGGDQGSGPYPGGSIVSTDVEPGYYGGAIIGYVSPAN
jgi:hypothetical protein